MPVSKEIKLFRKEMKNKDIWPKYKIAVTSLLKEIIILIARQLLSTWSEASLKCKQLLQVV